MDGQKKFRLQFKLKRSYEAPVLLVILLAIVLELWDFLNNKCLDIGVYSSSNPILFNRYLLNAYCKKDKE